jgi:D-alanyl-D-alanine carboxypeptidase
MDLLRATVIGFLVMAPATTAQPQMPDTLAGNAFKEYIAALNAADQGRLGEVLTRYHIALRLDGQLGFAQATGGFNILRIEQSASNELTALLAERNSDVITRMSITVATDAAGQIASTTFGSSNVRREGEFAIPRMTQAEALKAFKSRTEEHAKEDKFSGAYLIVEGGKVLAAKAYGWADRDAKIPNTLQTKFRIGSMNKMFTVIATLQLVQSGKLSLDGTVGSYLPDYPNKEVAEKVTIRQLLTHTGGTGDFFGPGFDSNRLKLKTLKDYITLLGSHPLAFEPGTKDSYSNFGYIILGYIIERSSGRSYYDYVSEHIFKPAGMNDTDSLPEDQAVARLAKPYTIKNGTWFLTESTLPPRGTSAGGGYSTVGDLLKFAEALQTDKLLPLSVVHDATSPHNIAGSYGYGFDIPKNPPGFGHGGGSPGMNAQLYVFPSLNRVVVTASNFDPNEAASLALFYVHRMPATP